MVAGLAVALMQFLQERGGFAQAANQPQGQGPFQFGVHAVKVLVF